MTVDFSSETTLCKRHHASHEGEFRSDLKMLTIKSEEKGANVHSRNTGPCIGMPLRRYQQRVTGLLKDLLEKHKSMIYTLQIWDLIWVSDNHVFRKSIINKTDMKSEN